MKKRNENIEAEVSRTMKLLETMEPLEVNHYFRVRLMQRIEECGSKEFRQSGSRLNFRLAFMALLIMVNLGSAAISVLQHDPQATATISEVIDSLGEDYSSQDYAYYDQADQATASPADTVPADTRNP